MTCLPRLSMVLATVLMVAGGAATAQVCRPELGAALEDAPDPEVVTGVDAAVAFARAVTLVEPALPPLVRSDALPVPDDHPHAEPVRFLAERGLLPSGWSPDALTPSAWREMVRRFLAWYALEPEPGPPVAPADHAALVAELARVLERIAGAVRPAALFATDPDEPSRLAFRALIWNWTRYPRLIVFRARGEPSLDAGPEAALASLETCARRVTHWFSAPAPTARQLFLANHRADMVVVGADEASGPWPWWVPEGEELAVFAFAHPRVAGADAYAVVFAGPSIGVAGLVRLLPQVRTNVGPLEVRRYLQTPL